jgi:tubulin---tyrosine ligase
VLFRQRKFDIRVWALISHDCSVYIFKEGYVRTSSEPYNLDDSNLDQIYIHLTNNAV